MENLALVSADGSFVVIEVGFSSFEVDVGVVDHMVLPLEPLSVNNDYTLLTSDFPLLDVEGDLQIDGGVPDVVVEIDEAAGIDLQVRVGGLELVV